MKNQTPIEQITNTAKYYQEKGENELVKDIFATVMRQKKDGSLTNAQLQEFVKKVSPILNAQQRERLNSLIEQLLKT
ncbi:MAG: hypothetical protein PHW00_02225 [Clostridia bacterium]|nr:hypothetical protein [Clostridia bacterium]